MKEGDDRYFSGFEFERQIETRIKFSAFSDCALKTEYLGKHAPLYVQKWQEAINALDTNNDIDPKPKPNKGQRQFETLVSVIESMGMEPLDLEVGEGEKPAIHSACVKQDRTLFTDNKNTFNGIWQKAVANESIKITNNKRS